MEPHKTGNFMAGHFMAGSHCLTRFWSKKYSFGAPKQPFSGDRDLHFVESGRCTCDLGDQNTVPVHRKPEIIDGHCKWPRRRYRFQHIPTLNPKFGKEQRPRYLGDKSQTMSSWLADLIHQWCWSFRGSHPKDSGWWGCHPWWNWWFWWV